MISTRLHPHQTRIAVAISIAAAALWFTAPAAPAAAAEAPMLGTVIATRPYVAAGSGEIQTEVTLSTPQGPREFTMRGGVMGGRGMWTESYTELSPGDGVVVDVDITAAGDVRAITAPALVTGAVSALAVTDYSYDGYRWDTASLPLPWRFNPANAPGGAQAAVQAAASTWEDDPYSAIDYTYAGTTDSLPGVGDGVNTVGWRQSVGTDTLAHCTIWFEVTRSTLGYDRIIEFDIDFNRAVTWSTTGASGAQDVQSIALHELGHSLHLGDLTASSQSAQAMYGFIAPGTTQRSLGDGDQAGVRHIYPSASGEDPPPVTDPPVTDPPPPAADTVAPVTTLVGAPTGWSRVPVSLQLSATDTGSGVGSINYRLGSGAASPYAGAFQVAAEGVTRVGYWSVDVAGNAETERTADVRIDSAPPAVMCDAAAEYTAQARVTLTGQDALSGVLRMTWRLDSGPQVTVNGAIAQITVSTTGDHTITYSAEDAAGNRRDGSCAFVVLPADSAAPVTTASGVPSGWATDSVTVDLAPDDAGAMVRYRIGDGATLAYSAPFAIRHEGETAVTYWSQDAAGNVEQPRSLKVRIDRTSPVIEGDVMPVYRGSAGFSIGATDTVSGVAGLSWSLDGGTTRTASSGPVEIETSRGGAHLLTVQAQDAAGNVSVRTIDFRVAVPVLLRTTPSATSKSVTRRRGRADVAFTASATSLDGRALRGVTLVLERSYDGRRWTRIAKVTTPASGYVKRTVRFTRAGTTHWRWRALGSTPLGHEPRTSRSLKLRIR